MCCYTARMTPPSDTFGMVRDVSLFLREEHTTTDDKLALAYAAKVTLDLDGWTYADGPDFGLVTILTNSGDRVTFVSYDIEYLRMVQQFQEGQPGSERVNLPGEKFAFMIEGWPEDWGEDSGLARFEADE